MGYEEGFRAGAEAGGSSNPFGAILGAIGKAQARRYAEDKERKNEEKKLTGSLLELGKKFEYDRTLKEFDAKQKQQELFTKGLTEGTISETTDTGEGTFEGLPGVKKRYKPNQQLQAITDAEGNVIGYRPKGGVFQPSSSGGSLADKSFDQIGGGQTKDISEADIQYTMKKHKLTREEVLKRLGR